MGIGNPVRNCEAEAGFSARRAVCPDAARFQFVQLVRCQALSAVDHGEEVALADLEPRCVRPALPS